ncbi:MAG: hypothetical protein J6K45_04220, partial [Clostridia bacterium]|nr:hypothetical protein [Clostridia bacterium]
MGELEFIQRQLSLLNGTGTELGFIEQVDNEIERFLAGRELADLDANELRTYRNLEAQRERLVSRRDELTRLQQSTEELQSDSAMSEEKDRIDQIAEIYSDQEPERRLTESTRVATYRGTRFYESNSRRGEHPLSISAGSALTRANVKPVGVRITAKSPVSAVYGDSLELMKQAITLRAVLDSGDLTPEQTQIAQLLYEKVNSKAQRQYAQINRGRNVVRRTRPEPEPETPGISDMTDEQLAARREELMEEYQFRAQQENGMEEHDDDSDLMAELS